MSHTNKIRKMKTAYISENHDNFRKPELIDDQILFNYFDSKEVDKLRMKIYDLQQQNEN